MTIYPINSSYDPEDRAFTIYAGDVPSDGQIEIILSSEGHKIGEIESVTTFWVSPDISRTKVKLRR